MMNANNPLSVDGGTSSLGHQLLSVAEDLLLSCTACTQGLRVQTQVTAREDARAEGIITMGQTTLTLYWTYRCSTALTPCAVEIQEVLLGLATMNVPSSMELMMLGGLK